jgi:hypothetical protein
MSSRPSQTPRAAEVVQNQMRSADAELGQASVQVLGVAGNGVLKVIRLVGFPETGHVEGHRPAKIPDRADELFPVTRGAWTPVQEDDRFVGCGRPGLQGG